MLTDLPSDVRSFCHGKGAKPQVPQKLSESLLQTRSSSLVLDFFLKIGWK